MCFKTVWSKTQDECMCFPVVYVMACDCTEDSKGSDLMSHSVGSAVI